MDQEKSSIWDWLAANGQEHDEDACSAGEVAPRHRIDDETLLALETEAEVAARLRVSE
jgi:hypothetical protein